MKVSIIIPIYNVASFIIKCLESVATQSCREELECILVDDCGSDNSITIASQYIESYKGSIIFKIVHHSNNRGLAAARNTGVRAAKGEFIVHLDSDDWLEPNAIELLANKQQETNADIVSGNAIAHKSTGNELLKEPDYTSCEEMIKNTIQLTLDHVIWRRLIRRSLYTDNNVWTQEGVNIGEDHHTLPRLVYYANRIAKVDQVIYHYNCMNPNSYMSNDNGFSLYRFQCDYKSINILASFFQDKDLNIYERIQSIKKAFLNKSYDKAICYGNKDAYHIISSELGIRTPYYFRRYGYLTRDLVNRLTHKCNK